MLLCVLSSEDVTVVITQKAQFLGIWEFKLHVCLFISWWLWPCVSVCLVILSGSPDSSLPCLTLPKVETLREEKWMKGSVVLAGQTRGPECWCSEPFKCRLSEHGGSPVVPMRDSLGGYLAIEISLSASSGWRVINLCPLHACTYIHMYAHMHTHKHENKKV